MIQQTALSTCVLLCFQCAYCKEYFIGKPTKGHQCYRTMTVNKDYCLDPLTQAECTRSPGPLRLGRTVLFVVQPKYVNVDIRVTIDVAIGGKCLN